MRLRRVEHDLAFVAQAIAGRDQHADTRGVEEGKLATVEHDPSRTRVDELIQQIAQLRRAWPCRSRRER